MTSRFIAFLLLNPENLPVLKRCKALEQLQSFAERDPLYVQGNSEGALFVTVAPIKQYMVALLESRIPEVVNVLLWLLTRITCKIPAVVLVTNLDEIPNYVKYELLPVIRMYANHQNAQTRKLARSILTNVDDSEFFALYDNIETWVKSLNIGDQTAHTYKKLVSEQITLHRLLNPDVTLDQIQLELQRIGIKSAATIDIIGNLVKLRNEVEESRKLGIEIANALKLQEKEINIEKKCL